ncbi:hypothetical protein PHPALM_28379 [Phytophthora palmivora]|uniref:Cyclic nucleotide-binding domain-containing protein n=1 Tax=Phytophthora palmivora TaxID=4796 RepID=A0A2P4XA85_9STRA|nr:hypothetical protein PHPALM_28379 [Phytophthora palmivora]
MEESVPVLDVSESDRVEYDGKKASLALQRALKAAGQWMVTSVRDERKCDHPLLPVEMPANIRAKVAKILQDRGNKDQMVVGVVDPKAHWHQQLEQHVARLMHHMRSQPQKFRQMLLMAASEANADCVGAANSMQGFVDYRKAYRRLRQAAMALGEEIFFLVRAFVRRSEANGVLPQDAQAVRLASLYKLELRRNVTIRAVMECIHEADTSGNKVRDVNMSSSKNSSSKSAHTLFQRQIKSAGVTSKGRNDLDSTISARAVSAPADATGRGSANQPHAEPEKIKSVHAFKLQALERLLATSWHGSRSVSQTTSMRSVQALQVNPTKLSDETLAQIQERVTAFLYHRSRENYPLWSEPLLSREETARHLRVLVATLLTTPLLQGLTIEQLLEIARSSRWQILAPGDTLCLHNTEIEALIIVIEGSFTPETVSESTSGPIAAISAPSCLGELGMVRNAERWPQTLTAQSPEGAKVLTLPKLTFETLLHRFFNSGKIIPSAFAAVTNLVQPRRPSSSPAVVARRLARTFKNSLSDRRPSTAAPTIAMETNIARWHEVRDEKLRDYRAGLEAEERAAALEALQKAMEELASSAPEDEAFLEQLVPGRSPRKAPWSHHEYYPSSNLASDEFVDPEQSVSSSLNDITNTQEITSDSATDAAEQLREFYRSLNERRSVMRSRLAFSAPSDQIVQLSAERKNSNVVAASTAVSESTWWVEEEKANNWGKSSEDEVEKPQDCAFSSVSATQECEIISISSDGSPYRDRQRSSPFSERDSLSPVPSSKDEIVVSTPITSPLKPPAASPTPNPRQESNTKELSRADSNIIRQSDREVVVVPEINEFDKEISLETPSTNQVEDHRPAASTHARKSALNSMLAKQSTVTMARHSKLLDKETAQQVLIQKHFADNVTSAQNGAPKSPGSRPQSAQPQLHTSHSNAPLPLRADLQRRMDSVLNDLLLSPKFKLDLVLKYTHVDHYDQFPMAVQLWECAQGAVAWRERVMKLLWDFEMLASDPRRHFRSISTHRLREEKQRDALFYKLNQASTACSEAMDELMRCCGDTLWFGDRSYRDKMKKDYTELLYEVEQERLRIIYSGVHPHVASAIDENDTEPTRDEDDVSSGRPSSGRTLINEFLDPLLHAVHST